MSTEKTTIIDSVQNVKFVTGQVPDARKFGFMAPCPDTTRRIAMHDAQSRTPGSPQRTFVPLTGMPDEHKYTYTINPWTIREHDQKFFNSLIQIVGDLDDRERFIDAAGGSGRRLISILINDATRASDEDRTLVSATFNEYVTAGLGGPFEKKTFDLWWKRYSSLLRILPNDERPNDYKKIQMLSNMIYKDPEFRQTWKLNKVAKPLGTNHKETVDRIKELLLSDLRSAQIDSRGAGNSPSPSTATADGCASRAAESARAAAAALQLPWLQPAVQLRTKSAQQRARSKPVPFPE